MIDTPYIQIPFADQGPKTKIPNLTQTDGSVSFQNGYGGDYSKNLKTEASAKPVPRLTENWFKYAISANIKQFQETGFPNFITPEDNAQGTPPVPTPFPYALNACVWYKDGANDAAVYISLKNNNVDLPSVSTSWQLLSDFLTVDEANELYGRLSAPNTWSQYQTMPAMVANVYRSTVQTIDSGNIGIKFLLDTVEFDDTNLWSSANKRYQIAKAGYYEFDVRCWLNGPGANSGSAYAELYKNGQSFKRFNEIPFINQDNITLIGLARAKAQVGDFFELFLFNATNVTLNAGVENGKPPILLNSFGVQFIGT